MILDASAVLAWLLKEPGGNTADRLLGRADLAAPSLLIAEVGHTLTKYARRGAISRDAAQIAWRTFIALPMRFVPLEVTADRAFEISQAVHAVFYDCVYLALADQEQDLLVTLDESFLRAVRASGLSSLTACVTSLAELP